jgi:hypothetical protein
VGSLYDYSAVTKRTLLVFGCDENTVIGSLTAIFKLAASDERRQQLNQIFQLDDRVQIQSATDAV